MDVVPSLSQRATAFSITSIMSGEGIDGGYLEMGHTLPPRTDYFMEYPQNSVSDGTGLKGMEGKHPNVYL